VRIVLAHAPGLVERHLDVGILESLTHHPPTHRARLVPSFPATPAAVGWVLRTGVPPRDHGVHHREDEAPTSPLDLFESSAHAAGVTPPAAKSPVTQAASGRASLEWWCSPDLHDALVAHGEGSAAEQSALRALDTALAAWLGTLGPGSALVLAGAPAVLPVHAQVVGPTRPEGWSLRTEGRVGWLRGPGGKDLPSPLRDAWLRTPGVACVLSGRALELLGCDPARGAAVVAEPGWSFEPGRGAPGPGPVTKGGGPVVLAWTPGGSGRWPTDVHDTRVAPTLTRAAGIVGPPGDSLSFP
jgi:hypothetical protein